MVLTSSDGGSWTGPDHQPSDWLQLTGVPPPRVRRSTALHQHAGTGHTQPTASGGVIAQPEQSLNC